MMHLRMAVETLMIKFVAGEKAQPGTSLIKVLDFNYGEAWPLFAMWLHSMLTHILTECIDVSEKLECQYLSTS